MAALRGLVPAVAASRVFPALTPAERATSAGKAKRQTSGASVERGASASPAQDALDGEKLKSMWDDVWSAENDVAPVEEEAQMRDDVVFLDDAAEAERVAAGILAAYGGESGTAAESRAPLSLDLEGIELSKEGAICLLQLGVNSGVNNGTVYLFDIWTMRDAAFRHTSQSSAGAPPEDPPTSREGREEDKETTTTTTSGTGML